MDTKLSFTDTNKARDVKALRRNLRISQGLLLVLSFVVLANVVLLFKGLWAPCTCQCPSIESRVLFKDEVAQIGSGVDFRQTVDPQQTDVAVRSPVGEIYY
jgi:hypothetical protein